MTENNIRKLLKKYGASDVEIENFMEDLSELKDDVEDFSMLDKATIDELNKTEEGKDILMNAPKMKRSDLKIAIANYIKGGNQ